MQTDFLSPLVLVANSFQLGAEGDIQTPNTVKLLNPNRTAMLVDQFRIGVGVDVSSSQPATSALFTTLQCKLGFGATPLTNDFIPVLSFMPTYRQYGSDSTYTWHLARPLYVPPNVQVSVAFKRKQPLINATWNNIYAQQSQYTFSIAGRSMPEGMETPEKIYVPWACATSCYNSNVPFVSGDSDIGNPFDTPLSIDYFCGYNISSETVIPVSPLPVPFTFQATLSNGKVLARDPTPFLALFPPNRPILRSRAVLQPKEFVSVVLDVPATVAGYTNLNFTTVGMTGWRELNTPLGAAP